MEGHVFLKCYGCGFHSTLRVFSEVTVADVLLLRLAKHGQIDHRFGVQTCGSREPIGQLAPDLAATLHRHNKRILSLRASRVN
jgi:hypothetical protein